MNFTVIKTKTEGQLGQSFRVISYSYITVNGNTVNKFTYTDHPPLSNPKNERIRSAKS